MVSQAVRTLSPVRACPVYHPRVKAKTSGPTLPMHHHLPGLDAGWCGTSSSPRRDAGASRGRRLTGAPGVRLTIGRKGDAGTDSATPADWGTMPPHLNVATVFCCWGPLHGCSSLLTYSEDPGRRNVHEQYPLTAKHRLTGTRPKSGNGQKLIWHLLR